MKWKEVAKTKEIKTEVTCWEIAARFYIASYEHKYIEEYDTVSNSFRDIFITFSEPAKIITCIQNEIILFTDAKIYKINRNE